MEKEEEKDKYELIEIQPELLRQIDKRDLTQEEYETLVQMGIEAGEVKIYAQWILGKLADAIAKRYGDLKQFAYETRQNYATLRQLGTIYRKYVNEDPDFSPLRYAGSIPWGVLALIATKSDKPQRLLNKVIDRGMEGSIEKTYRAVKEEQTGMVIPSKPVVHLSWNEKVEKYDFKINLADIPLIDWSEIMYPLIDYLESIDNRKA